MESFGGCVLATGCEQGGAKNQAQEGYCRLPIADCRLPIADCRLPIADCRLPIADSTATAFAVKLVWLVCVMSFPLCYANDLCHRQKPLYPQKPRISSFFVIFYSVIPACAGMTEERRGYNLLMTTGFFMPGEWGMHSACWMAWPCRVEVWGSAELMAQARTAFANVARAIAGFEPVKMIVNPPDVNNAAKMLGDAAEVIAMPIDDSWLRDSGMTFVRDNHNAVAGINWRFNAWGEKYKPFDNDNAVAKHILQHLQMRRFDAPLIMEGGSFHCDGEGTILTSEQCLLHPNRNPHLSRADIEKHLCHYLGGDTVIWLVGDERDTETDGHIDNIACFVAPGAVLLCGGGKHSAENLHRLQTATDSRGRRLHIRQIPSPSVRENGAALLASYINFYPANGGIVMPSFGVAEDDAARGIIAQCFAGRRVVQVDARAIIRGGGGIHCITQQQPAGTIAPPEKTQ